MASPSSTARSAERRRGDPVGPQAAPPRPLLVGGEAPGGGRRLDRAEPGLEAPVAQVAAGVGLAAVGLGDRAVHLEPPVELGRRRVPAHRPVDGVARGHHAVGPAHPPHLAQRGDRIGQVLEHLVGVHHVERVVGVVEGVHVAGRPARGSSTPASRGRRSRRVDGVGGGVDADHPPGRHPLGQVDRDRARAAPDVEQVDAGSEVGEQVGGRVLDRPPAVRAQHALGVAVRVGLRSVAHGRTVPAMILRTRSTSRGSHGRAQGGHRARRRRQGGVRERRAGGADHADAAAGQRVPPAVGRRRGAALPRRRGAAAGAARYFPPVGGFRFGHFTLPPDGGAGAAAPTSTSGRPWPSSRRSSPGWPATWSPATPGMHTTATIDFEVVLSGSVTLELDDGATVTLDPGDTVVQNGTRHRWSNPGDVPVVIAVFLVGAHHDRVTPSPERLRAVRLRRGRHPPGPARRRAPRVQQVPRRVLAAARRRARVPVGVLRGDGRGRLDRRRHARGVRRRRARHHRGVDRARGGRRVRRRDERVQRAAHVDVRDEPRREARQRRAAPALPARGRRGSAARRLRRHRARRRHRHHAHLHPGHPRRRRATGCAAARSG